MERTPTQSHVLKFGVFEVDLTSGELRKSGMRQNLSGQPFEVLRLLLEHPQELVTREELRRHLWPNNTFVDYDLALKRVINRLRDALGDSADNPRFIETIPRKGYRFITPVVIREVKNEVRDPASIPSISDQAAAPTPVEPRGATAVPGARSWLIAGVVLFALLAGGAFALYLHRKPVLTEKDTIVLGDFSNTTGDFVFDDTLKEELSIQLQQSSFLRQISDSKVNETLKLMGESAGVRLNPKLAQQVCLRNGGRAMLTGSISSLGKEYVIGLKAITCDEGDLLAEEQVQAKNKEGVLRALDTAAVNLRTKLGEALIALDHHTISLEEATTPSLDALEAYSLGQKTILARGWAASIPFFMRSVELDPHFARAYVAISGSYANLGQKERAAEYSHKAFELRANVSEAERFHIETFYYAFVTGELEKVAEVSEQWHQTYPRSATALTNLAAAEASLGRNNEALEHGHEALQLEPEGQVHYAAVGNALVTLDRFEDAETLYNEADRRKLDGEQFLRSRYRLAFLKADAVRMSILLATATGKPGIEHRVLASQAETEAWYGKFKSARDFAQRAINSAVQINDKEEATMYEAMVALWEAEVGNTNQATAKIRSVAKKFPGRNARSIEALVLARSGDTVTAEQMAAELNARFSHDTLVQKYWLPSIRAAIRLRRKEPRQALEILETPNSVELSAAVWPPLAPAYLRGQAYLMLHDGRRAEEEFRKLIVHRGLVANAQFGVLSRLGLASALSLQGDLAGARTEYQEFLNVWKDADPDSPILVRAKSDYATLQSMTSARSPQFDH